MDTAPLMRLTLIRTGGARDRLVWTFSHAILDGRSFTRLLLEVFDAYDASGSDVRQEEAQAADPRPYRDYVDWAERQDWSDAEAYWTDLLDGFTAPTSLSSVTRRTGLAASPSADSPVPGTNGADAGDADAEVLRGRRSVACSREATNRIHEAAREGDVTVSTLVNAAWGLVLSRYTGDPDVVFGATRAGRKGTIEGADDMVGVFINTVPVRVRMEKDRSVRSWLQELRRQWVDHRPYEHAPLTQIQGWTDVPRTDLLFESLVVFERYHLQTHLRQAREEQWSSREVRLLQHTGYPFTLYGYDGDQLCLDLEYAPDVCPDDAAERLLRHVQTALQELSSRLDDPLREISILPEAERQTMLVTWNDTDVDYDATPIHRQFEAQAARTPDAPAMAFADATWTYRELDARANRIAHRLAEMDVRPGDRVGVCMERSLDMMATLFGILKAGGAYVPLDPDYPADRIAFMVEDATLAAVVAQSRFAPLLTGAGDAVLWLDRDEALATMPATVPTGVGDDAEAVAYVIYTSGSTGTPKGVMVTHRNVANFFAGMDARIERSGDGADVWLAVTSISFDISVLELFWTLSRGFKVVLQTADRTRAASRAVSGGAESPSLSRRPAMDRDVAFSLFYFSSDEKLDGTSAGQASEKYRLLLEGAAYGDEHGFEAVWTPERHFHDFGGLYPNPSVISAAIAARTQNIHIRAGSCVSPLHHPVRIAEDWSVVDNLSDGRVGISFAAGWQPNDFVIQPQNFAARKTLMFEQIKQVRALWRGDTLSLDGPTGTPVAVQTLPRPVQKELPVWVTAAGNPETFEMAGTGGYHLLTHLLGQSVDDLAEKIAVYRRAWRDAGHAGDGKVTLMLHTFVGDNEEEVRATVREPMKSYLRSSIGLIKKAAWSFPTFKQKTTTIAGEFSLDGLSDEEMDAVLDHAFQRYYATSGLFGTPEQCLDRVAEVAAIGVDEVACLLDFGIDAQTVLNHLPALNAVKDRAQGLARQERRAPESETGGDGQIGTVPAIEDSSISVNIKRHRVTHLQCTPSQARMLMADAPTRQALSTLRHLMVGGEAFPPALARDLRDLVDGRVTNMYGPTETTIWSSTWDVTTFDGTVPIGTPIANTTIYLLDEVLQPVPVGIAGDLWIGGDGVTKGYLDRGALTAERFVDDPFRPAGRMYKTGDLARYASDGTLEFLGRNDFQVKMRGHRIEIGEIEAALEQQPDVRTAVVRVITSGDGNQRLVAYLQPEAGTDVDTGTIRDEIADRLPAIMIPGTYMVVDSLPLTPNGKIDRAALPDPDLARESTAPYTPPSDATEETISEVWKDVLGVDRVGAADNFFDLGGHSLLAVQVVRQLGERLGQEVPIVELFQYPTVRSLAAHLGAGEEAADAGATRGQSRAAMRRQMLRRGA
jgi:natural product biosynthesis luciferase-like monooxygenase protein